MSQAELTRSAKGSAVGSVFQRDRTNSSLITKGLFYGILTILTLIFAMPIIWLFLTSLKTEST